MPGSTSAISRTPSALEQLSSLLKTLRAGTPVVFLDYDGTLTPIVEHPDLALLPEAMRDTLSDLARHLMVAVISGRALADIQQRVGLPRLYYAGNHGMELIGPAGSGLQDVRGAEFRDDIAALCGELEAALATLKGVFVENKGLTLSVHYRMAGDNARPTVEGTIDRLLQHFPGLRKHRGKKVFEVRPGQAWHKGDVVKRLLELAAPNDPVPLYIGDDITDEDAFSAVADNGIGIRVSSEPQPTAASYSLRDCDEVRELLQIIGQHFADRVP